MAAAPHEGETPASAGAQFWGEFFTHGVEAFARGVSIAFMRAEAARAEAEGRNVSQMWRDVWAHETLPPGWVLTFPELAREGSALRDGTGTPDRTQYYLYTNTATAETMANRAPAGCTSMLQQAAENSPDQVGPPTDFVSFPWSMPFRDVVAAVENSKSEDDLMTKFFWIDVLCLGYHNEHHYDVQQAIQKTQSLVQVTGAWNNPERLKRMWMMLESFSAAAAAPECTLSYAMTPAEQGRLADALRLGGPAAILGVVMHLETNPENAQVSLKSDRDPLLGRIQQLAQEWATDTRSGQAVLNDKLANLTRKAYAGTIDRHFQLQWQQLAGTGTGKTGADILTSRNLDGAAQTLDLGHQLACLWAMTDDLERAEALFRQVLAALPHDTDFAQRCAVARCDRTAAALEKLLLRQGRASEAHNVQKEALGELAVSWQGLSIAFLEKFAASRDAELRFLSTDAMVERVIKPACSPPLHQWEQPSSVQGRAFIETVHDDWKGKPTFFLSHAWRQTFHVSGSTFRGGMVQALVDSVRCEACENGVKGVVCSCQSKREQTYVWLDIFCVNQHSRNPYDGGLQAFSFDPLRNAIVESDHVRMFLETWDDPATLSRVWCLDELRTALLLGKEVRICMPAKQMQTFRQVATVAEIERVVQRIDIEQASATFPKDRINVLKTVEDSVGKQALNDFCRQIVRVALLQAAGINDEVQTAAHVRNLGQVLQQLEKKANELAAQRDLPRMQEVVTWYRKRLHFDVSGASSISMPPHDEPILAEYYRSDHTVREIEIRRAVALMRMRIGGVTTLQDGEIERVSELARRFYGEGAQVAKDIDDAFKFANRRCRAFVKLSRLESLKASTKIGSE
jgi:hypothetical protein